MRRRENLVGQRTMTETINFPFVEGQFWNIQRNVEDMIRLLDQGGAGSPSLNSLHSIVYDYLHWVTQQWDYDRMPSIDSRRVNVSMSAWAQQGGNTGFRPMCNCPGGTFGDCESGFNYGDMGDFGNMGGGPFNGWCISAGSWEETGNFPGWNDDWMHGGNPNLQKYYKVPKGIQINLTLYF